MSATDDVLNQADALMRRHRSFVARNPEGDNEQSNEPDSTPEAEIPVLTEIVAAGENAPLGFDAILDALRQDIESELSDWLVGALPAAVASASQHIIAELDAKARHALLPRLQEIIAARRTKLADDQPL